MKERTKPPRWTIIFAILLALAGIAGAHRLGGRRRADGAKQSRIPFLADSVRIQVHVTRRYETMLVQYSSRLQSLPAETAHATV